MIYAVLNAAASPRIFYDVRNAEIKVDPGELKYVDIDDGTYLMLRARGDLMVTPATFERHAPYQGPIQVPPRPAPVPPPRPPRPLPPPRPVPPPQPSVKPAVSVTGHFGIGDNLHQRAVMRELMKSHEVWLHTCHFELYHDLVQQGLKLVMRPTTLHAQARTIKREQVMFAAAGFPAPPPAAPQMRIGYPKTLIDQHGSILEAQFSCVGLRMPERPDFSLPIKPEWTRRIRERMAGWDMGGKPLMVHRPVVVRREWDGRSRNPDPRAYDELFRALGDTFFIVSLGDLVPDLEWIDGPRQKVNIELLNGELDFPEMAALFAEANLVFCNAGFAPVLAQATGTPFVCIYGGRESWRTTQRIGAHLAPALPIDVVNPCDCHSSTHQCDKRIDMAAALPRLQEFAAKIASGEFRRIAKVAEIAEIAEVAGVAEVAEIAERSTLLFGTFYVDSPDRDRLTDLWIKLHISLNERDCDFLAVDSQSPIQKFADWAPYDGKRQRRMVFNFPDNIGHLSRRNVTAGRDGWGRAFCKGLEIACELGYDHVIHVEGDSLLRFGVADVVAQMKREGIDVASTHVNGRFNQQETEWVETGLMFMSVDYVKRSDFVKRYDWPNRKVSPTPERYILQQILRKDLNVRQLRIMPWKAIRSDRGEITTDNVLGLDWITHQHDSTKQVVYEKFVEAALATEQMKPISRMQERASAQNTLATSKILPESIPENPGSQSVLSRNVPKEVMPDETAGGVGGRRSGPGRVHDALPQSSLKRLNLGCGTNKLDGWENHDADVDITKPLPWEANSVGYISIEHCVEHVPYKAAIAFFREAHRVLAPSGVLRVTVPSLEQIAKCDDPDYHRFTAKWQPLGSNKRGAMHAIIYAHGHEAVWNSQMMRDTLFFAGFDEISRCQPGQSEDPVLRGVEGHGKVIGHRFNEIESCTHEARKSMVVLPTREETVAIVIGGAECWQRDLEEAQRLTAGYDVQYFVINDHIKTFPEPAIACTLHPDKLNGHFAWLITRRKNGLPEPIEVWAHRKHAAVTHDTASQEWTGSSGLFTVQVARRKGHQLIIGCGVPMTVEAGHFERHMRWQDAIGFRSGWLACKNDLAPYFRSMSGWTAEQFGRPSEDWLDGR